MGIALLFRPVHETVQSVRNLSLYIFCCAVNPAPIHCFFNALLTLIQTVSIMLTGDDMRINTRFPVAVHMMTLISYMQKMEKTATSEILAKSVGTNPVVIRQMMSMLRKAGLIETRNGASGIYLTKKEEDITLLDIYKAVQDDVKANLFDFHANPNPACFVGGNIRDAMEKPLYEAQLAMEQSLAGYSLKDIINYIDKKMH